MRANRDSDPFEGAEAEGEGAVPFVVGRRLRVVLLDYRDIEHPEAGGAEVYMHELFRRVAARGHRVTWISAGYPGARPAGRIGGIRVVRVGNKATANITTALAALRLARREHVDVFVENICKIPFLMPVLTRVPVLPIVLHLFGHTVFAETNAAVASYVWLFEKLIPPVYKGLPFIALSDSTASDLRKRGVRASRMDILPPGLDIERYQALGRGVKSEIPLVVYVGRLKRYKQMDIVIRAFAQVRERVPAARLAIIGKGDDRPRLEALSRRMGLGEAVTFEGFVSEAEKIDWLHRAHVVVYASPREGWGISATEAAACGTPVVASDSEGLREAVCHGTSGFLVPHQDVEAWAQRIGELLTDARLRQQISAAAAEWARRFDWEIAASKLERILQLTAAGVPK
jgi:glycosyltransferase involved in cell wall biosynthesis